MEKDRDQPKLHIQHLVMWKISPAPWWAVLRHRPSVVAAELTERAVGIEDDDTPLTEILC